MVERRYNIMGCRKRVTLCHTNVSKDKYYVYMEAITEEQEKEIDKSEEIYGEYRYETDEFDITGRDIYLFGEVNLEREDDRLLIKANNLINDNEGSWIISDYDYDTGEVCTREGILWKYPTYKALEYFKYCYVLLGKPSRIIIYRKKYNNATR